MSKSLIERASKIPYIGLKKWDVQNV
jgi:hypothetical protein